MRFPAKITSRGIWVATPVDWVILHWYACGATDGRLGGRAVDRCTVTWLPNFLAWVDYFIFLPLVLRWRTSRARASLSSYKRRFRTTKKMDRHITWNVMWWFSNIGLSVIGCLRIFKLRLCYKMCTCLTSYLAEWNCFLFCFVFFLVGLCRITFNTRQALCCPQALL